MKKIILFLLVCAFASSVNAAIVNGSFEELDIGDYTASSFGAIPGWTGQASCWLIDPADVTAIPQPTDGQQYSGLDFWQEGYSSMKQSVSVSANTLYTFTVDAWLAGTGSGVPVPVGHTGGMSLSDGIGTLAVGDISWDELLLGPDDWTTVTLTWDSTGYSGSTVNLIIDITGGNTGIMFDNVTMVPEPATMMLLSLGGLALRRRRKA